MFRYVKIYYTIFQIWGWAVYVSNKTRGRNIVWTASSYRGQTKWAFAWRTRKGNAGTGIEKTHFVLINSHSLKTKDCFLTLIRIFLNIFLIDFIILRSVSGYWFKWKRTTKKSQRWKGKLLKLKSNPADFRKSSLN